MKKFNVLATFLIFDLLLPLSLYAETATVTGRITRTDNRPAASVIVSVGGKFNFTDVQGEYIIKDVPFGQHTLQIMEKERVLKSKELVISQPSISHNDTIP